jgi:gas vesicle protein
MEYDEHSSQVVNFVSAVIGAGIALLTAPESGRRTRKRIRRVANDARDTATDRWDELADDVKGRVDDALKVARKRLPVS